MSNQKSLCCYADIKLTGKERPDAFECVKCGRIIGTELPDQKTKELIEETWESMLEDACIACNGTGLCYDKVSCSNCEGHGFDNPIKHLTQLTNSIHLQSAEEAEGRRVEEREIAIDDGSGLYENGFNASCKEDATYHRSQIIK